MSVYPLPERYNSDYKRYGIVHTRCPHNTEPQNIEIIAAAKLNGKGKEQK